MLLKKFLDLTLVGEYFILVAVYLIFFLLAIDFSVGKKSWLFSASVVVSLLLLFLLSPVLGRWHSSCIRSLEEVDSAASMDLSRLRPLSAVSDLTLSLSIFLSVC